MKQSLWQTWVIACGLMPCALTFKVSQGGDAVAGQAANKSIQASPLVTPSWHPDCMARPPSIDAVKVVDDAKLSLVVATSGEVTTPTRFAGLTTATRNSFYNELRESLKISDVILVSYKAMIEQATMASWIEHELWQAAAFKQVQLRLCRENAAPADVAGFC